MSGVVVLAELVVLVRRFGCVSKRAIRAEREKTHNISHLKDTRTSLTFSENLLQRRARSAFAFARVSNACMYEMRCVRSSIFSAFRHRLNKPTGPSERYSGAYSGALDALISPDSACTPRRFETRAAHDSGGVYGVWMESVYEVCGRRYT